MFPGYFPTIAGRMVRLCGEVTHECSAHNPGPYSCKITANPMPLMGVPLAFLWSYLSVSVSGVIHYAVIIAPAVAGAVPHVCLDATEL